MLHKKLLYITPEYPPIIGGTGMMAHDLVDALEGRFSLIVLTSGERNETCRQNGRVIVRLSVPFKKNRFHHASIPSTLFFALLSTIRGVQICRKEPVVLMHAFEVIPAGFSALVIKLVRKVPYVVTAIGAAVYDPCSRRSIYHSRIYRWLLRRIFKRADQVTAISNEIREKTVEYYCRCPVRVIPPGIRLEGNDAAPHRANRAGRLICIARLASRKNIHTILLALSSLSDLRVELIIIGDGPERNRLVSLTRKLSLHDRVVFEGFVSNTRKKELLAQSDIFILPSLYEGFGIVFLEAMAAGLPVICGNRGGQTDFVTHMVHGIHVDSTSVADISHAITRLLSDRPLYRRMSSTNQAAVKAYDLAVVTREYCHLYSPYV